MLALSSRADALRFVLQASPPVTRQRTDPDGCCGIRHATCLKAGMHPEAPMQMPVQITFRGIERSPAIEDHVRQRAAKLGTFFDRIIGCHTTVEAPHQHQHRGRYYRVLVDLTIPGAELVVGRTPNEGSGHEDVYAAIDDTFDDARRVLQDHVRKQRGDAKWHEGQRAGRVSKLFTDKGYGFLETRGGDEIYFHQNSVLHHGFRRMLIGTEVRFVEEIGERGPQASTVIVRGRNPRGRTKLRAGE
jgi:ribosomal subunit interface protein